MDRTYNYTHRTMAEKSKSYEDAGENPLNHKLLTLIKIGFEISAVMHRRKGVR